MIRVLFRPSPETPLVDVLIDERKHAITAILERAHGRTSPGPFDPMEEAGSEARYRAVMRERAVAKTKKAAR